MRDERKTLLQALSRDYGELADRSRFGLQVSIGEGAQSYPVSVLGIIREQRYLIATAPRTSDNALIAVLKGQVLDCRWLNATTAFRFRARIVRLAFEPVPLMYLELPRTLERHPVRGLPRALTDVDATVNAPYALSTVVVDLSVGGARIALAGEDRLQKDQKVELLLRLRVLEQDSTLHLNSHVAGELGATDPRHPRVSFYGLNFEDTPQTDLLVLHAYVQERLALEADWLTQVLLAGSEAVDARG